MGHKEHYKKDLYRVVRTFKNQHNIKGVSKLTSQQLYNLIVKHKMGLPKKKEKRVIKKKVKSQKIIPTKKEKYKVLKKIKNNLTNEEFKDIAFGFGLQRMASDMAYEDEKKWGFLRQKPRSSKKGSGRIRNTAQVW